MSKNILLTLAALCLVMTSEAFTPCQSWDLCVVLTLTEVPGFNGCCTVDKSTGECTVPNQDYLTLGVGNDYPGFNGNWYFMVLNSTSTPESNVGFYLPVIEQKPQFITMSGGIMGPMKYFVNITGSCQ
eukprot:TRINITY_DN7531_c0_g1_i1.p1 TRINITY_DN7531_c0_g1~~TRINITY_DN7531_c0_g1_i1.p1  ORF type:complete len:128 (-),score=18.65 TRINITY_DN7531_c0_g1_i1:68-451(-)